MVIGGVGWGGVGRYCLLRGRGMGMSRFVQMSKKPINLHISNHLVPFGWALLLSFEKFLI